MSRPTTIVRAPRVFVELNRLPVKERVIEHLDAGRSVALDLADTVYVDASVLGVMVALASRARNAGAALILANPDASLRELFNVTRLDTFLEIADALPAGEIDPWVAPEPDPDSLPSEEPDEL